MLSSPGPILVQARVSRLKGEHAVRISWEQLLSERQEILEPMVQVQVRRVFPYAPLGVTLPPTLNVTSTLPTSVTLNRTKQ